MIRPVVLACLAAAAGGACAESIDESSELRQESAVSASEPGTSDETQERCELEEMRVPDGGVVAEVACRGGSQGRNLIGEPPATPWVNHFSVVDPQWSPEIAPVPPPVFDELVVEEEGLWMALDQAKLDNSLTRGLQFQGLFSDYSLRIAGTWPDQVTGPGETRRGRYVVEYRLGSTGAWTPLCPDGDYAYVVRGMINDYSLRGTYDPNQTPNPNVPGGVGTFVCRKSAAAKAIRAGYSPSYKTASGEQEGVYFETATRVMRADYCGLGKPNTLDGTSVLLYDLLGYAGDGVRDDGEPPLPPRDPEHPFFFEAAWAGKGRLAHALCLSKLRWQTLKPFKPHSQCDAKIPDPRLRNNPSAKFCEDLGLGSMPFLDFLQLLGSQGAWMYSSSQFNDPAVWHWTGPLRPDGTFDVFATTEGFWGGIWHPSDPPAPGYKSDGHYVANISATRRGHFVMPELVRYYNPNTKDVRTTTKPVTCLPIPCVKKRLGHVYKEHVHVPLELKPVALVEWTSPGGDWLIERGDATVPGYTSQGVIGWGFEPKEPMP